MKVFAAEFASSLEFPMLLMYCQVNRLELCASSDTWDKSTLFVEIERLRHGEFFLFSI